MSEMDEECFTCAEMGDAERGECPPSLRPCKHHCNHIWDQDCCHWCGAEVNDDGAIVPTFAPLDMESVPT